MTKHKKGDTIEKGWSTSDAQQHHYNTMKLALLWALVLQTLVLQDVVTGFLTFPTVAVHHEVGTLRETRTAASLASSFSSSSSSLSLSLSKDDTDDVSPLPQLVVLIPAYNEQDRIVETLETYSTFLKSSSRWKDCSRIVVIDDGSADQTVTVVQNTAMHLPIPTTCVSMPVNGGKGAALAFGMDDIARSVQDGDEEEDFHNNPRRATIIVTTDADGSAPPEGIDAMYDCLMSYFLKADSNSEDTSWMNFLSQQPAVVAGYRTYQSASPFRLIFRWGFRTAVRAVCGDLGVQDSQCGFKLLTIPAATRLYRNLNIPGWSHDVEVLYRARELGVPVMEQETEWEDKDGSKLLATPGGVLAVVVKMAQEIVRLREGYEEGGWKLPT